MKISSAACFLIHSDSEVEGINNRAELIIVCFILDKTADVQKTKNKDTMTSIYQVNYIGTSHNQRES